MSSPEHREFIELCEDFTGLEEDTKRYDLLLLVKRAGKLIGFTPRMVELLDYYMSFTRDIDWAQGARPIIYQSLSKTALDLGVSERHIQRLEQQLFKIGALTWNDSGNHRRYGQRCNNTGRILYAYGVELTPLAYLKEDLQAKLQEKQLYDQAWMETKRQVSWYRRQICATFAEIAETETEEGSATAFHIHYEGIAKPIRTYMRLSAVRELLAEHKSLHGSLMSFVYQKNKRITDKESPNDDSGDIHYNYSTQQQSNKLDKHSSTNNCFQKSSSRALKPSKTFLESGASKKEEETLILKTGLQHITLKQALNASSNRLREHLPLSPKPMTWNDFTEAALKIAKSMGISQKSWGSACKILGRSGAAVCVILTDQAAQRDHNPIAKPAAYFNAMIKRGRAGELNLQNSIFGILKRDEGH